MPSRLFWTIACVTALTACRSRTTEPPAADADAAARAVETKTGDVTVVASWIGGTIPPAITELPAGVHKSCGRAIERPVFDVQDGRIRGVVVSWDGAPHGSGAPGRILPAPSLDQVRCAYTPSVLAASLGSELTVKNSDPLIHNVRAEAPSGTLFNFAMPLEGMTTKKKLDKPGILDVRCDVHPWMRAWIRIFDHSRFSMTDAGGAARLEGLPVGRQKLSFWHPELEPRTVEVEVAAESPASVTVEWRERRAP